MTTARWWVRRASAGQGVHDLARDATLRLRAGRAEVALRVTTGCVLVTREGDPEDHVLAAGDELRLEGTGLVVAWALSPARLVVAGETAGARTRPSRREKALAAV